MWRLAWGAALGKSERITDLFGRFLMLVTALVPQIGSDHALEIAKFAQRCGLMALTW
jgi:fumarate hydratase class II